MKKLVTLLLAASLMWSCDSDMGSESNLGPSTTGQGGSMARFSIAGDHLFAVNGTKLKVFDIGDVSSPRFISDQELNVDVETIFARDENTLFIGSTSGMIIYDISNAPQVQFLSRYDHVVACDPVVANQTHAYVTLRSGLNQGFCARSVNQLDVLDISDLRNPNLIHTEWMDHPRGLGLYGDTLLVCDNGVKVMNIADPLNPGLIEHQPGLDAMDIIPYGDLMIVATSTGLAQYRYSKGRLHFLSSL